MTGSEKDIRILVFTEGTILMHRGGLGYSREDIVQQVKDGEESVLDFGSYVPIGDSVKTLQGWSRGAEIVYLTSRRESGEVEEIREVLERHGFPEGLLEFRRGDESYGEVAERLTPDVLVEDDCESIGGYPMTTISQVRHDVKRVIKSLIIKEFEGIHGLPNDAQELMHL